jgi:hypothetical protein
MAETLGASRSDAIAGAAVSARILAEITDCDGLTTALRARAVERNLALSSAVFGKSVCGQRLP